MKSFMRKYAVAISGSIAVLLAVAAAVVAADAKSPGQRAFTATGHLDSGAEVEIAAEVAAWTAAAQVFPGALWWGREGSMKPHVSSLKVTVGGNPSWVRLSAYSDLTDVQNVELKVEDDGFTIAIEGGEQATHYRANVYFDREGYLLRRRVEGASFPSEVWEETNYSFIRRKDM